MRPVANFPLFPRNKAENFPPSIFPGIATSDIPTQRLEGAHRMTCSIILCGRQIEDFQFFPLIFLSREAVRFEWHFRLGFGGGLHIRIKIDLAAACITAYLDSLFLSSFASPSPVSQIYRVQVNRMKMGRSLWLTGNFWVVYLGFPHCNLMLTTFVPDLLRLITPQTSKQSITNCTCEAHPYFHREWLYELI